ncbi:hypothetical protein L2E82_39179 [Cichorium intybus]|uniref:Uncharacterized protein n=1 Tax=Cichorium intybus TaxID=13427 RepID=A0ACB9AGR9_CICIN|nr:hypothetical protein L2E82_39179 [Cichorium intybus]
MENELVRSSSFSESCVSDSLICKLLAAANKYDLGRLRRVCESHLCKGISVNSLRRALALADNCHAIELKTVCLRFAAENLEASTVMLITVIWGTYIIVGKCHIVDGVAGFISQFSLLGSGVSTDIWTTYSGIIMAVSMFPFIVVQFPQILH